MLDSEGADSKIVGDHGLNCDQREAQMSVARALTEGELEAMVANAVAGHKMAGFDITEDDRVMLRKVLTGELTGDQIVAKVRAKNAAVSNTSGD